MNLHELFEYDNNTGNLSNIKTKHIYRNRDRDGYIRIRILGKEYRAHRLIWEMFKGPIPSGYLIDHIDRNVFNNKIENLRLATPQQNQSNSTLGKRDKALRRGITVNPSGRYRARISYKGTTYSLGTFSTVEEAEKAIKIKDIELRGEFSPYYNQAKIYKVCETTTSHTNFRLASTPPLMYNKVV